MLCHVKIQLTKRGKTTKTKEKTPPKKRGRKPKRRISTVDSEVDAPPAEDCDADWPADSSVAFTPEPSLDNMDKLVPGPAVHGDLHISGVLSGSCDENDDMGEDSEDYASDDDRVEVKPEIPAQPISVKPEQLEEPDNCMCSACNKTFPTETEYVQHIQTCFQDTAKPSGKISLAEATGGGSKSSLAEKLGTVECDLCKRHFVTTLRLQLHMKKCHPEVQVIIPKKEKPKKKKVYSPRHMCEKCYSVYFGTAQLTRHVCDMDIFEIDHNNKIFCKKCNSAFESGAAFGMHKCKKGASYVSWFQCDVCHKFRKSWRVMRQHRKFHFAEKKVSIDLTCETCGGRFKTEKGLGQHRINAHDAPAKFRCAICDKGYYVKNHYDDHMKMHRGERAYQCDACGKSFTNKTSLLHHIETHNEAYIYECTICDKKYRTKKMLYKHTKDNHDPSTNVQCLQCGKIFKSKENLKIHNEIHLDRKKYKCDICGAGFNNGGSLSSHKKKHKQLDMEHQYLPVH